MKIALMVFLSVVPQFAKTQGVLTNSQQASTAASEALQQSTNSVVVTTAITDKSVHITTQSAAPIVKFQNNLEGATGPTTSFGVIQTNRFIPVIGSTDTIVAGFPAPKLSSTTNQNTKAILNRVANEANSMLVKGQVFQIQAEPLETGN